jgi:hypothetical protein
MKNEQINSYIKDIFGNRSEIERIEKLLGGVQKSTYKIDCNTGQQIILHIWDIVDDLFYEKEDHIKKKMISNSAEQFKINNEFLIKNSINTPKILKIDISKEKYPFEFAFVKCINNGDISEIVYGKETRERELVLNNLQKEITKLHSCKRDFHGKLINQKKSEKSFIKQIYDIALHDLEYSIKYHKEMDRNKGSIIRCLEKFMSRLKAREEFSLIHNELGPEHVLINKNHDVFLIDLEGLLYADIELEHAYLKFRFEEGYNYLKRSDLDYDRLIFYKLYLHISHLYGHLKLLYDIDYQGNAPLKDIIDFNSKKILRLL